MNHYRKPFYVRWLGAAGIVALLMFTTGCANKNGGILAKWFNKNQSAPVPVVQSPPDHAVAMSRLTNRTSGLETFKWVIPDDPLRFRDVLLQFPAESAVDKLDTARLARNGFRIVRIHAERVPEFLEQIGNASVNASTWHGEVYQWRRVQSRNVGRSGQAVAINGRIRPFHPGDFELTLRCWTVQMEYGPVMQLNLMPRYHRVTTVNFRQLLGENTGFSGETFASSGLELLLDEGYAYIMTCRTAEEDEVIDAGSQGPAAITPPTLGEMLFRSNANPSTRTVLVMMPRLPDELFPEDSHQSTGISLGIGG